MIEGNDSWIIRNNISDNNDGIVCIKSHPEIITNKIIKNKSNGKINISFNIIIFQYYKISLGIMLITNSYPKIKDNLITDNDGIGLFIRSDCRG